MTRETVATPLTAMTPSSPWTVYSPGVQPLSTCPAGRLRRRDARTTNRHPNTHAVSNVIGIRENIAVQLGQFLLQVLQVFLAGLVLLLLERLSFDLELRDAALDSIPLPPSGRRRLTTRRKRSTRSGSAGETVTPAFPTMPFGKPPSSFCQLSPPSMVL